MIAAPPTAGRALARPGTADDYLKFHDRRMADRFARGKVPMTTLLEAYFDGRVDLNGDIDAFIDARDDVVRYSLTAHHLRFLFTRFIPEVAIHSKSQDERIVRAHYDRGDDFFGAFLGERMVYTSAYFGAGPETSLEDAQDAKMNRVCEKLRLAPTEKLLDVGCGWGTLARHAAKSFGADATGVTISENQALYAERRIREDGLADRARVLCKDYRDIPAETYDKIVSLEMVEHVGVRNLRRFFEQMYGLLRDDGLFVLQWTGLRRGMRKEDLVWGLFMNEYIFPGADASLPLGDMVRAMEGAGFEVQSVENMSTHYALTIRAWHKNWVKNREAVLRAYGERWFRIWNVFLAWSARIAEQGNAACFQLVANKNLDRFDRGIFVGG